MESEIHENGVPKITKYGEAILSKYHPDASDEDFKVLRSAISGSNIEEIEKMANGERMAYKVFRIRQKVDNLKIRDNDKKDILLMAIVLRLTRAHEAILNNDPSNIKQIFTDHETIRRRIRRSDKFRDLLGLMDYEKELMKYARNKFNGKPAEDMQYENLIISP